MVYFSHRIDVVVFSRSRQGDTTIIPGKTRIVMLLIPEEGKHDAQALTDELVELANRHGIRTFREELAEGTKDEDAGAFLNEDDKRCFRRFTGMTGFAHGPYLALVNMDERR